MKQLLFIVPLLLLISSCGVKKETSELVVSCIPPLTLNSAGNGCEQHGEGEVPPVEEPLNDTCSLSNIHNWMAELKQESIDLGNTPSNPFDTSLQGLAIWYDIDPVRQLNSQELDIIDNCNNNPGTNVEYVWNEFTGHFFYLNARVLLNMYYDIRIQVYLTGYKI